MFKVVDYHQILVDPRSDKVGITMTVSILPVH